MEPAVAGERAFRRDVRALLTQTQLEQWPRAERVLRREMLVGMTGGGAGCWSQQDLWARIAAAELPDRVRAAISPLVGEYEEAIDRPLKQRESRLLQAYPLTLEEFLNPKNDDGDWYWENSLQIARVNRKYTRLIAEMLPSEIGARFENETRRSVYRDVYERSQRFSGRVLEAALRTPRAETETAKLEAIRAQYERESSRLEESLIAMLDSIEEDQLAFMRLPAQERLARIEGGTHPGAKEWTESLAERDELERTTSVKLRPFVTEKQWTQLELELRLHSP
jgi:hypothetical protein